MALMLPSKPDPYVPDAITQAMARRGSGMFPAGASDAGLPGVATASNVPASTRAQIASVPVGSLPAPTAAPGTASAPASRVVFDPNSAQSAALRPAGMTQLAPGVSRSEIPGVYTARGRDGSMMFSNVTGPDGQPTFAGSAEEAAGGLGMGRRGVAYAGGSQADPRYGNNPVTPGWREGDGAQGGTVDRYAGQVDPNGLPAARGTAGMTFANVSGGMTSNDVGNMIDSRTSPFQIESDMQDLAKKIHDDPNASNPQVAAANNQAMQRLTGAYYDKLRQFYGGNGAEAAMLGGAAGGSGIPLVPGMGVGGGRGGIGTTIKDIASARADTENAATNAAKAQSGAQLQQQAQDETQLQNIIKTLPADKVAQLQQLGITPTDYARMSQFLEHGGDIYSSHPDVSSMRQQVQRLVAGGISRARGPLDIVGNALDLTNRPYFNPADPGQMPNYRITTDNLGNPVLQADDGNYVNLGGSHPVRQAFGYGDSDASLRSAWNDPVLQKMIVQLAQPSGMDRR